MNISKVRSLVILIFAVVVPAVTLGQQISAHPADQTQGHVLWKFETGG
jgi:hypothetical protein